MASFMPSPFGGQNREKLTTTQYVQGILGTLFVLGCIVLYGFEFKHFSNTFGVKKLVLWSLAIGAIAGGILAYFVTKSYDDLLEKFQVYVFFVILTALLSPLVGSLSNRWLSFAEKEKIEVELVSQSTYTKSRFGNVKTKKDGYFIFFVKGNKIERVKTKELFFPNVQAGDAISIFTRKGFWGFEYFVEDVGR